MWRRLALALALLAATAPPVAAHQGDPTIVTRIDAVTPSLDGVTIEVRAGVADQLLVVNTTPTPLTVMAAGGEPFLRIGGTTVEANVASPDWYTSNSPLGAARVPPTATPKATPDWRVVSRTGSWGWFDHRLHPATTPLTNDLRNGRRTVRLAGWTIPFRYGDRPGTVTGHVEYRPLLGAFRSRVEHVPEGASLDVLDGRVPGLFLRWNGAGTLVVRGIAGEPFARLASTRTEVNAASETWQDDRRLRGAPVPDTPADPAKPAWGDAQTPGQLTWLDRRLAYAPGFPPDDVARGHQVTTMVEWDLPVEIDGRADHLRGTTSWHPSATGGGGVPWPVYGAAVAAAVVASVALRRTTRREDRRPRAS